MTQEHNKGTVDLAHVSKNELTQEIVKRLEKLKGSGEPREKVDSLIEALNQGLVEFSAAGW